MTFAEVSRRVAKLPLSEAADLGPAHSSASRRSKSCWRTVRQAVLPLRPCSCSWRLETNRSLLTDLHFEANLVTIHERKKSHDKRTTPLCRCRRCCARRCARGSKSIREAANTRFVMASTSAAAGRHGIQPLPITPDEEPRSFFAVHWLARNGKNFMAGMSFDIRFAAIARQRQFDQRIINAWVGHLSDECFCYRHLLPDRTAGCDCCCVRRDTLTPRLPPRNCVRQTTPPFRIALFVRENERNALIALLGLNIDRFGQISTGHQVDDTVRARIHAARPAA